MPRHTDPARHLRKIWFILPDEKMKHYTYIVRCADDTLYTGYTCDLEKRIETHNKGKGAKYTRSRLPVSLVYYETFDDKVAAMQREYAIKRLTRDEKIKLIKTAVIRSE